MARRYKRKNEFRMDLNKKHYGDKKKPHPAYITAEYGNLYKANNITHSEYLKNGRKTKKLPAIYYSILQIRNLRKM